ncbi:uncharacterized protein B0T15DRAFT_574513 [Chaetomium strumarium]|uniref:Uncharacterized protein n=1 Tax=Chaetomium strumarium TaxID=1170767 RepID=A0AAJ0GS18_9PEZI|nr:hypothetical protein B0T15DRAFT_574513 [Chaetomium strumarium]
MAVKHKRLCGAGWPASPVTPGTWSMPVRHAPLCVASPARAGSDSIWISRALFPLRGSVPEVAMDMVRRGLAAWDTLHPTVRERMSRWSPLARQLWDSPFPDHQEAMVRAWIWHYLDDNIFSFSGDAQGDELVPCASPVWEHVRALRRALDGLRTGEKESMFPETLCRQFHMLRRLIESLVVDGLGLKEYVTAADFIPHFKKSLRLLVDDGHAKIPDRDHDVNWDLRCEDPDDEEHEVCDMIKDMLYHALELRFFIHGMIPSYTIRFIPIGSNSLWGFPVDRDWMSVVGTPEISQLPPGERPVRVVQLVSDPMLVISGEDWEGYEKDFKRWPQQIMRVFAPWCRDGEVLADYIGREDEEKRLWPILEENGQERMVKRLQEEEEQMEEVEQEKRPKRAQEIVGRVTRSMSAKGAERVKRPKRAQEIVGRVTRSMSAKGAERVKRTE